MKRIITPLAAYANINEYVKQKLGRVTKTCWIARVQGPHVPA